jgi:integrase
MRVAHLLSTWLDQRGVSGDLTPACDPRTLNEFLRDYLTSHEQNGVANVQRNLRTLFRWIERETGTPSPFKSEDLDHYVALERKPKTLNLEFIRELLGTCAGGSFTGVRDEAIIRLLLEGMRVGEMLEITPDDVPTLTDPVIRLVPRKGERRFAADSGRRILLEVETVRALQRYMRTRTEHPLAATVFAAVLWLGQGSATPFGYNGVRLMLIRRCRRLGYDQHATAYMFRHTFAHDYRANGGSIDDLVEHMGWTGPGMAYRYGKDMAEDRAIEAKRRLGNMY